MKLQKITLYIIDFEKMSILDVITNLEMNKYLFILKSKGEEVEIGEWYDEHNLNFKNTPIEDFEKYFEKI